MATVRLKSDLSVELKSSRAGCVLAPMVAVVVGRSGNIAPKCVVESDDDDDDVVADVVKAEEVKLVEVVLEVKFVVILFAVTVVVVAAAANIIVVMLFFSSLVAYSISSKSIAGWDVGVWRLEVGVLLFFGGFPFEFPARECGAVFLRGYSFCYSFTNILLLFFVFFFCFYIFNKLQCCWVIIFTFFVLSFKFSSIFFENYSSIFCVNL